MMLKGSSPEGARPGSRGQQRAVIKERLSDSKAEALEARGLYRRAAVRWLEVMMLCTEDDDRLQAKRHRERCLKLIRYRDCQVSKL